MEIPGTSYNIYPVAVMTSARNTQIKLLGKLAAKLESDPRSPIEVIEQYFLFTDEERGIFWNAYKGDDPITADI